MAQQEGGWPLGLQPLNVRIGLIRNIDYSGSLSFSSLITGSPSSSSSDLDTESTGSFFQDRSITLGNLIGVTSSILELSSSSSFRRSRQQADSTRVKKNKSHRSKAWFSLCNKTQPSGEMMANNNGPNLGYFLEVERRASNAQLTGNVVSITYELNGLPSESQSLPESTNTLFSNGLIVPPQVVDDERSLVFVGDAKKSKPLFGFDHGVLRLEDKHCFALMFPCMGAQAQTTH